MKVTFKVCFLLALAAGASIRAAADLPVPIKDINARPGGAQITLGAEMNGYVYYQACPNRTGCELFRTPIGGSGAELVKDIVEGAGSSHPRNLVAVGGTLFFVDTFKRLWTSDGTEAGTQIVRSFGTMPDQKMVALGSEVLFRAASLNGLELWASGGTFATTTEYDLCPGPCASSPIELTVSGSRVFFRATDADDTELWKYEAGAVSQVGDIHPAGSSLPNRINAFGGGGAIFFANDAAGFGLWKSDGAGNTKIASASESLHAAERMVVAGGNAYFDGCCAAGQGKELWISNGTTGGTFPIKDIRPGPVSSEPQDLTAVGSSVFFSADDGSNGRELWISTGTAMNTVPLELVSGAGAPTLRGDTFTHLNGSELFFAADNGAGSGLEPWKSNGTPGGTVRIADLEPGSGSSSFEGPVLAIQNQAFFASTAAGGPNLWRSDGTSGGTVKLTDLEPMTNGSGIERITVLGSSGYFCADDGFAGTELWKTDGTTAGSQRLENVSPGPQPGCSELVAAGSTLYFVAHDGTGWGLWKSNGSAGGAALVRSFPQVPQHLTAHNGQLFFAADAGAGTGQELWKSDGTVGNTVMVEDIYLGSTGSNPRDLTSAGGYLYFAARTAVNSTDFAFNDVELHRSDGTEAGTFLVADVYSGTSGSFPTDFAGLGSEVLFTAWDAGGTKFWKSNGMQGNLTFLKNIIPADPAVVLGSFAYLAANDGSNGIELWKTDGTSGNTTLVEDIRPGSSSSSPQNLTVVGSKVLFSADDGTSGREPWITDGTSTILLDDIASGSNGSNPKNFFATGAGDDAYFSADDGTGGGSELWQTDGFIGGGFSELGGVLSGTSKVADLYPDGGSSPGNFAKVGANTVFTADVGVSGDELWSFGAADCGDGPEPSYPTTVSSAGACHRIGENTLFLGSTRDDDPDGQPTATADGDDADGSDDEDGVTFTSAFNLGDDATFTVTLSAAGRLNVWIDWNANGDWNDPEDHVIYNLALGAGAHSLSVPVPDSLSTGTTYARFRLDTQGTTFPGGIVFDGEVEDYEIELVELFDYGDAPDPLVATGGEYPTLLANDGARHRLRSAVYLGSGVDADTDGQPGAGASGDDADGNDDEDGVVFTTALLQNANATVEVTVSTLGYVSAWIDFDRDGAWTEHGDEEILDEVQLTAGTHPINFAVPAAAPSGATYARFRFDTNSDGYRPVGLAEDGEVEDYQVFVGAAPPAADAGSDRSIAPNNQPVGLGGVPAATGGTPPYSYSWSISPGTPGADYTLALPTDANPTFTGLTEQAFTATLTVTDANLLQDGDSALITVEIPAQRDLYNESLSGTQSYEACGVLTVEQVTIETGASIVFRALAVILGDNVVVQPGADLTVVNSAPSSCPP